MFLNCFKVLLTQFCCCLWYAYVAWSQSEEKSHLNISLEQRFHELEIHYAEATTLLHLQGTLILDLQVYPSQVVLFHFQCFRHVLKNFLKEQKPQNLQYVHGVVFLIVFLYFSLEPTP